MVAQLLKNYQFSKVEDGRCNRKGVRRINAGIRNKEIQLQSSTIVLKMDFDFWAILDFNDVWQEFFF